jgi:hypothetical protein
VRRLKAIHRSQKFAWLSRDKVQELATALAEVQNVEGSDWVMKDLPAALSLLCEPSGSVQPKLIDALLEIDRVKEEVAASWETKHAESMKEAQGEIEKVQTRLAKLQSNAANFEDELKVAQAQKSSLEATLVNLKNQMAAAKGQAQRIFEAELKQLAQSPATMAILGAWGGASSRGDRRQLSVSTQSWSDEQERVSNFGEALVRNLKRCGLSPGVAVELSIVCQAALAAGQLISFRSPFSDILTEAVASGLGKPVTLLADVPAGLLDPVDWNSLLDDNQKRAPIILQAANRSDISLVLGSMRVRLFREALGFEKPSTIVLITLEHREEMRVEADTPFGPIVDDHMLKFHGPKGEARLCSYAEYAQHLPDVKPFSTEEFATSVGEEVIRLPLFSASSQTLLYRRSYSALRGLVPEADDLLRLFFKYWCLPRIPWADAQSILEAHKEEWRQDDLLIQRIEAATRDE